ncbi:MAG: 5'-deoxynucleotidase [Firmicutes bacterium]|nr:5'-deoxynucleotidase [Bacillota bacterium]
MKKHYHFFAMASRMKHINRWGLMRNTHSESLSEHSHETAVLAHALAILENSRFGGDFDPDHAAAMALFHDTTEIITGDLPTPVKYYSAELREAYRRVENAAADRLLSMLPEELRKEYDPLLREQGKEAPLVKAADKLSALIKCIEEGRMGNRDFASAEASLRSVLQECPLQSVAYFCEHFLPSYSLTLDEQSAPEPGSAAQRQ